VCGERQGRRRRRRLRGYFGFDAGSAERGQLRWRQGIEIVGPWRRFLSLLRDRGRFVEARHGRRRGRCGRAALAGPAVLRQRKLGRWLGLRNKLEEVAGLLAALVRLVPIWAPPKSSPLVRSRLLDVLRLPAPHAAFAVRRRHESTAWRRRWSGSLAHRV
jgi:hypothetical protein